MHYFHSKKSHVVSLIRRACLCVPGEKTEKVSVLMHPLSFQCCHGGTEVMVYFFNKIQYILNAAVAVYLVNLGIKVEANITFYTSKDMSPILILCRYPNPRSKLHY